MTPLEETNRRVRVAAAARGWTLGQLANQAGIAHATLSRAIAGKTPWEPTGKTETPLFKVARALGILIEALRPGGSLTMLPLVRMLKHNGPSARLVTKGIRDAITGLVETAGRAGERLATIECPDDDTRAMTREICSAIITMAFALEGVPPNANGAPKDAAES